MERGPGVGGVLKDHALGPAPDEEVVELNWMARVIGLDVALRRRLLAFRLWRHRITTDQAQAPGPGIQAVPL